VLNNIIESCKYVTNNSTYVRINEDKFNEFIKNINKIKLTNWLECAPYNLIHLSVETIVNFLVVYESILFCFWGDPKWEINTNVGKQDGSFALLYALLKYVRENNTTDFSNITQNEFAKVLQGNVEIPLFKERFNIIRDVSKIVNEKMNGNFYKFIKNINKDIKIFNIIINYFPSFKDERIYKGKTIYLYKLAQLLTSDILHIRELKENIKVDYSNLLGCSDYKIPQVMRGLGILEYNIELSNIVDNKQEIEVNSEYEIEIRANMIVAIDMIKGRLDNKISAININDYIWGMSKNKTLELTPYHLTKNKNY